MKKCNLCSISNRGYYNYHKKGNKILIVSDFPTRTEVKTGIPSLLQGSNNNKFNKIMSKADINTDDISFASLTRCIPENKEQNNKKTKQFVKKCTSEHLSTFIKKINPEIIIIQGAYGLGHFFHGGKLDNQRGKLKYWNGYKVIPTYSIKKTPLQKNNKINTIVSDLKYIKELVYSPNKENLNLKIIKNKKDFDKAIESIKKYDKIGADIETTGVNPYKGNKLFGIGISVDHFSAYYFPIRQHVIIGSGYEKVWSEKRVNKLKNIFEGDTKITFHYSNFDIEFLRIQEGWDTYTHADSLVLAHLLDENKKSYKLEYLTNKNYTDLVGFKEKSKEKLDNVDSFDKIPLNVLAKRCCIDSIATLRLTDKYIKKLKQDKELYRYYKRFRRPLLKTFIDMQETGYKIDLDQINKLEKKFNKELEDLKNKMWDTAETRFNPRSSHDLREILYNKINYDIPKGHRTDKTNAPKTDNSTLKKIKENQENDFIKYLLRYKKVHKLKSNYVEGFKKHKINNRIHSKFRIAVSATGRSSSQKPNAQNIAGNKDIKSIITVDKGYNLIEMDYKQAEARLFAYLCGSDKLSKVCYSSDVYRKIAAMSTGKDFDNIDPDGNLRNHYKMVVLALLYGMGDKSLAGTIDKTENEATKLRKEFFNMFPSVPKWKKEIINFLKENGYVKSVYGRKRHLPSIWSSNEQAVASAERQAVNHMVQSPTFDFVSTGLRRVKSAIKPYNANIILTVHDSILGEVIEEKTEQVLKIMKKAMEKPVPPINKSAHMQVDAEVGKKWGYLKEIKI